MERTGGIALGRVVLSVDRQINIVFIKKYRSEDVGSMGMVHVAMDLPFTICNIIRVKRQPQPPINIKKIK